MADTVGGALLIVLDTLTPPERVAFVLHTCSASTSTRSHGSSTGHRPRLGSWRAEHGGGCEGQDLAIAGPRRQRLVIDVFLRAARGGDLRGLVAVLAPDVVFRSDPSAVALAKGPARVEDADAVASAFSGRARQARAAMINGSVGVVVAPGGQLVVILRSSSMTTGSWPSMPSPTGIVSTGPSSSSWKRVKARFLVRAWAS